MFALFDGHGGNGMSTKLANELHLVIHQNLEDLLPSICEAWKEARQGRRKSKVSFVGIDDIEEQASCTWHPSLEELITGGLESAFWMMDKAALASKKEWKVTIALKFLDICAKKNSKHKKGCLIFLNGGRRKIVQIFFKVSGGSTALVALFICDRVFVANAGDSRAVVYRHENQFTVTDTY